MRLSNKVGCVLAGAVALASCGTNDRPRLGNRRPSSDLPVKIGAPYQVGGRTYVPRDEPRYDATGYASWYGAAHRGRPTANGERFDPQAISAAHTTLPLPSYVSVTALDTGRTILVRVNDRGPFVSGRIIDLSQGAARLLGIEKTGVARVRVRRVMPSEADRVALRAGRPANVRGGAAYADAPTPALSRPPSTAPASRGESAGIRPALSPAATSVEAAARTPVVSEAAIAPVTVSGASFPPTIVEPAVSGSNDHGDGAAPLASPFYVQVAVLDDADRADALASLLRTIGPAAAIATGPAWQVRLGPYEREADALSALARARRAGYQDAHVVRDSAR